ncbi:MAG: peptidoglycan DD-metalloendopeptidase family protein [Candidatus Andersenbacteria bacterium]|nr:peptidoglycan DD-metalloendopeptidase family protein [Candidatus Andersenbacteria bacterium]MBI3251213.1 peptidoglycan DD-metalloendopeptidase family protein [Candidatus Andersenbacteria bacterium]
MKTRSVWLVIIAIVATLAVAVTLMGTFRNRGGADEGNNEAPPAGLALPFAIEHVRAGDGSVNPFGIVRFSQDRPEYGHAGIDIPLGANAAIFAVANGEILQSQPANDGRPGQNVTLHITNHEPSGEAWVFLYEHILLDPNLAVGSRIQGGQRIGQTALETEYNNHFQLSYAFNNFTYTRSHACWVEYLAPDAAADIRGWFAALSAQPILRDSWQTVAREGKHELRGLLDASRFPDGPQLCYPPGTDVRLPATQ